MLLDLSSRKANSHIHPLKSLYVMKVHEQALIYPQLHLYHIENDNVGMISSC